MTIITKTVQKMKNSLIESFSPKKLKRYKTKIHNTIL